MTSIGHALAGRDNALNLARLVMASIVLVSHTWPVGGFGEGPTLGVMPLSWWALAGFFGISGYLTAGSADRLSLLGFLRGRATRILPGYWCCLAVIAFVFAPVAARLAGAGYAVSDGVSYLLSNVTTVLLRGGVGSELAAVPLPGMWDGSIWTLSLEIGCYVVIAALAQFGALRRRPGPSLVAALAAVTVVSAVVLALGGVTVELLDPLRLASFYLGGAVIWAFRQRVPVSPALAVVALVVAWGLACLPALTGLAGLPLAYALLVFGARCPLWVGRSTDLSYGVYLYGWPVQQLAAVVGLPALGPWWMLAAVTLPVFGLAWLSWTLVEEPAQRRRRSASVAVDPVGTGPRTEALGRVPGDR